MVRKVVYWVSTAIVSAMLLFALIYLTGSEEVVSGFAKAGYPQHLRIVLGIAKPMAAIVLLLPGVVLLKEWAYAGATITWGMACLSRTLCGRWRASMERAADTTRTSDRLLRDQAFKPPIDPYQLNGDRAVR